MISATILNSEGTLNTPYKIGINVEKYNERPGNAGKLDLIKIVTINVKYKVGNKDQNLKMTRIKQREVLTSPNRPTIESISGVADTVKRYPIKYINSTTYEVCDSKDTKWYNYDNGYWALTLVLKSAYQGEVITTGETLTKSRIDTIGDIYVWIPRYAYNTGLTDFRFLYGTTNKYVTQTEAYSSLADINTLPNMQVAFGATEKGIWIKAADTNKGQIYDRLNSSKYQRKNI